MTPRSTQEWIDATAEHELILSNAVAYRAARAQDPEFRSVESQPLPDAFYAHAQGKVARGEWSQVKATAWLQAAIHDRSMVHLASQRVREHRSRLADGTLMARHDAMFHTLIKTGGMAGLGMLMLYAVTDPVNVAMVLPFAAVFVAFKVVAAAFTRDVF